MRTGPRSGSSTVVIISLACTWGSSTSCCTSYTGAIATLAASNASITSAKGRAPIQSVM